MKEHSLRNRAAMLAKTLASTVTWVVALAVTSIRGKVRGRANDA